MSHFSVTVIIPNNPANITDPEPEVARLLAPYDENDTHQLGHEQGWFADRTRWDWWAIGGRWDGGILGLERSPKLERCELCAGTGTRSDGLARFGAAWVEATNGCNGCAGTGQKEAWPTDPHYRTPKRNMAVVSDIDPDWKSYALVLPDGSWHERARMGWFGIDMADEQGREPQDKEGPYLELWDTIRERFGDHLAVAVDCHV